MTEQHSYISLAEAAKLSGYSAVHVRRLCASGEIPAQKVGNSWMVHPSEIQKFIKKKAGEPLTLAEISHAGFSFVSRAPMETKRAALVLSLLLSIPVLMNLTSLDVRLTEWRGQAGQIISTTALNAENRFYEKVAAIVVRILDKEPQITNRQGTVAGITKENHGDNNQSSSTVIVKEVEKIYEPKILGIESNEFIAAFRATLQEGLPSDILLQLKGEKGDKGETGPAMSYIPNSGSVFGVTAPAASNPGTIGSAAYLSSKELQTEKLTVSGTFSTLGATTLDDITVSGDLTVAGTTTLNGLVITNDLFTSTSQSTFTKVPTLAHVFAPAWPAGTSNASDGTIYINPASSIADGNLISAAVGGSIKFVVDAEGDVYANNLILSGSTSTGATTIAGNLTVQDSTVLGDAATDTINFVGVANSNLTFKKADPTIILDVTTATDTDFWLGVMDDAGSDDDDAFQIGDGTTPGTNPFLTIDTSGNVGIGTTGPGVKLHVVGGDIAGSTADVGGVIGATTQIETVNTNGAVGDWSGIRFNFFNEADGVSAPQAYIGAILTSTGSNGLSDLAFGTRASAAASAITEYMRIKGGGNVGIGTTDPTNPGAWGVITQIYSGTHAALSVKDTTKQFDIGTDAGSMYFYDATATTHRMVIDTDGDVGIGTTDPGAKLTVNGAISARGNYGASDSNFLTIGGQGSSPDMGSINFGDNSGWKLHIGTQVTGVFTPRVTFKDTGNVGIGTTDPGSLLTLYGDGAGSFPAKLTLQESASAYGVGWLQSTRSGSNNRLGIGEGSDELLSITFDEASSLTKRGYVGIGTTAPGSKLDVWDGNIYLSDADVAHGITTFIPTNVFGHILASSGTIGGLVIRGASDTGGVSGTEIQGFIGSNDPTDTVAAIALNGYKKDSGTAVAALGALETVFSLTNAGTSAVTVLGSGNVGIGTTVPGSKLDVYSTSDAGIGNSGVRAHRPASYGQYAFMDYAVSSSDAYFGSVYTGAAGVYGSIHLRQYSQAGAFRDVLNIDSGGNVGIGTTSVDAGTKLQVHGGVLVSSAFVSTVGSTGGIDYSAGFRFFSIGTSGSTKGTFTWIAKGADGSSNTPMIIHASGGVSFGSSTDPGNNVLLVPAGIYSGDTDFYLNTTSGSMTFVGGASGYLYPEQDGSVELGKSGNRWEKVWAANGTIDTSDQRYKTDFIDSLGLEFVMAVEPVGFRRYNDGEDTSRIFGFKAQQVYDALVEMGVADSSMVYKPLDESAEKWGINSVQLIAPLYRAVQELNEKLNNLEVAAIASISGNWSIDETGLLIAAKIQTKEVCFDDICVNKEIMKSLLEKNGLLGTGQESGTVAGESTSIQESQPSSSDSGGQAGTTNQESGTTSVEPVSDQPAAEPVIEPTPEPVVESAPAPSSEPVSEPVPSEPALTETTPE